MESIEITDRAASQIARGVLWIFSNEVFKKPAALVPGTWCQFHCRSKVIATGYANVHSLIFGRVVTLGADENIPSLLKKRLEAAYARRFPLKAAQAARLVYSEADFLPGLIVDVYADHLVMQSNTAGVDNVLKDLETLVPAVFEKVFGRKPKGVVVRADSGIRRLEGVSDFTNIIAGDKNQLEHVSFEEGGTHFIGNLLEGQKTGFFLDQKNNRNYLAENVGSTHRVLDLCCYSGGWGLRALKAGAQHVTFVDESKAALALVKDGLKLNAIPEGKARLVPSEIFSFLESASENFDVIVADPPAFVKSKKNLPQATKAYEKLNRLAWRRLKEGGLLITCSCSYHLSEENFLELLTTAVAKEKGLAHMVYRGGQAADHPVLLSMPETRYLKCVGLRHVPYQPANA